MPKSVRLSSFGKCARGGACDLGDRAAFLTATGMVFVMVILAALLFGVDRREERNVKLIWGWEDEWPNAGMWRMSYSGFEKRVAQAIQEQVESHGLSDLVDEMLVPTEEVVEVRRGAKVVRAQVFSGLRPGEDGHDRRKRHLVQDHAKVTGFLGTENKPVPITEKKLFYPASREGVEQPQPPPIVLRSASKFAKPTVVIRSTVYVQDINEEKPLDRGGVDLRPRHAGRAGIRTGREKKNLLLARGWRRQLITDRQVGSKPRVAGPLTA